MLDPSGTPSLAPAAAGVTTNQQATGALDPEALLKRMAAMEARIAQLEAELKVARQRRHPRWRQ